MRNNIRFYRQVLGISQYELGFRCGLSQNAISDLERGIYRPNLDTAFTICDVLHEDIRLVFPTYKHRKCHSVDTL